MHAVLPLLAAAALGIDVGWEPLPDGGFEYIIQIEPQTLDSMKNGAAITSQLPRAVSGMRGYRVTVGNAALPHQGEAPPTEQANTEPALSGPAFGIPPGDASPPRAAAAATQGNVAPQPELAPEPNASNITRHTAGFLGKGMMQTSVTAPPKTTDQEPVQPAVANVPVAALKTIANATDKNDSFPLTPLVGTMLALCASVAANVFLGWNTVSLRSRYRALVARLPGR